MLKNEHCGQLMEGVYQDDKTTLNPLIVSLPSVNKHYPYRGWLESHQ